MTIQRPLIPQNPSETQLQQAIINLAEFTGWRVHHSRPAIDRSGKWSTPIQGHKGFPDLVLVHGKRRQLWIVELKSRKGKLSDDQVKWAEALEAAVEGQVHYAVWTPTEWFDGTIDKALIG